MPTTLIRTNGTTLAEYATLKARVRETLILGQQQIEAAKVITHWRTGWCIQTHIRLRSGRADYGAQVFARLARDLEMDESKLRRCVYFVERLPHVLDPAGIHADRHESSLPIGADAVNSQRLLTWTHYRAPLQPDSLLRRLRVTTPFRFLHSWCQTRAASTSHSRSRVTVSLRTAFWMATSS